MDTNIIVFSGRADELPFQDEIEDRYVSKNLTHFASELLEMGIPDEEELEQALDRAQRALCTAHFPCAHHFRKVYIADPYGLRNDWLVSDLALRLIILNADVDNPLVARMQLELLIHHS
jgi:hypothetical protein